MSTPNKPITDKNEIQQNPDHKIDQDFNGYPHGTAKDETIKPITDQEKKVAGVDTKDGEKRNYKNSATDEQDADGSGNAFSEK